MCVSGRFLLGHGRLYLSFFHREKDFPYHRLTVRNERAMLARQSGKQRQLHPLHQRFDTAQRVAAQHDFMRGEDQPQSLLPAVVLEFRKGELIERQQQALFSRQFDSDRASVRIARPTFG